MKRIYLILIGILAFSMMMSAQKTVITAKLDICSVEKGQMVYLQQIGVWTPPIARDKLKPDKTFRLEGELPVGGFYWLRLEKLIYLVYLNPGDELHLEGKKGQIKVSGKGWIAENQLCFDNSKYSDQYYSLPLPLRSSFSKKRTEGAWETYQAKMATLKQVRLQPEFLKEYKGIIKVEYWQMMMGELGAGEQASISRDYYEKITRVKLSADMMSHGQWYKTLDMWLNYNTREKKIRLTTYENWLKDMALFIPDKILREAYLVRKISDDIQQGEFIGLPEAVKNVKSMIRQPENQTKVKELLKTMEEEYVRYAHCLPGTDLSAFEFKDRNGQVVKLGDLKGKYVYIDVWSTGCMPCKQEIPHLEKLQQAMAGQEIVFVSIAFDTRQEVWRKFIQEKELRGIQLIATQSARDAFCATMGIKGIPRFILLDKDCKVINFNAKRPSNPVLWNYLDDIAD